MFWGNKVAPRKLEDVSSKFTVNLLQCNKREMCNGDILFPMSPETDNYEVLVIENWYRKTRGDSLPQGKIEAIRVSTKEFSDIEGEHKPH